MTDRQRRALLQLLGAGQVAAAAFPAFLGGRAATAAESPGQPISAASSRPVPPPSRSFEARHFGSIGDGMSHRLSERFATLEAARQEYPFADSLDSEQDWAGLQKAIFAAHEAGGGRVRIAAGTYLVDAPVVMHSNVHLHGDGMGATVLRQSRDGFVLFVNAANSHAEPDRQMGFFDFTIRGRGDVERRQNKDRHFYLKFVRHLRVERLESLDCRYMALGFVRCDDVEISGCVILRCLRDAISCAGSVDVRIHDNFIKHCGDDAIAVHVTQRDEARITANVAITGNICEDTLAIKCVGATRAVIADNIVRRPKAYGIAVPSNEGDEGLNDSQDIQIVNNIVLDPIGWRGLRGRNEAIFLQFPRRTDGGMAAAAPGDFDPKTRQWVLPEHWLAQPAEGEDYPRGGVRRLIVGGNILANTLPRVAKYSDWGFGEMLTPDGWVDLTGPPVERHMGGGRAIFTLGAVNLAVFRDNVCYGFGGGLVFHRPDDLREVFVEANRLVRITGIGIAVNAHKGAPLLSSRIHVSGNYFDLDPFWENEGHRRADGSFRSDREASLRGGDSVSLVALAVPRMAGAYFAGNTLRNLVRAYHQTRESKITEGENLLVMEPRRNGQHGGIRDPLPGCLVMAEDCDPASPGFGQIIGRTYAAATGRPADGYWLKGQFVRNDAPEPDADGRVILGWLRLTHGDGHVPAVDWATVYAPTDAGRSR